MFQPKFAEAMTPAVMESLQTLKRILVSPQVQFLPPFRAVANSNERVEPQWNPLDLH